jgi:hypothetical protein
MKKACGLLGAVLTHKIYFLEVNTRLKIRHAFFIVTLPIQALPCGQLLCFSKRLIAIE